MESRNGPAGIASGPVSRWIDEHVEGLVGPYEFAQIAGGRSNITFKVTDARGTAFVLRRPPLGHVLATAHDMAREHRIITAVGTSAVPVPRTLALCEDPEVNGAAFYLMEFVGGTVLDSPDKGGLLAPGLRRTASEHLVDVLADLHDVDIDAVGLGDLARRDGYVERQIKRWTTQWENSKTRELASMERVRERLASSVPVQQGSVIAHGDYRFGNCLVDLDTGRVTAVLDWELCTLGDPLADLGYMGVYWSDDATGTSRDNDPTGAGGFATYADVVERYGRRTGRDVSRVGWYVAFSSWRLAVITEGVYRRYRDGAMGNDGFDPEPIRVGVEVLAEAALRALEGDA
jgi:aminoglycoside phosphotransferase (APT) family kinase protein